ncbi:hypothetical protein AQUCO_02500148v1 [Aquilegia coerulea]|uniref:F-box/LRR-repeat protein 15/At3g58940/PEG3-like LRR domain-containing protein n=1 Tax=Aquilegia coerulea TaxID=218851 RepID=A0A2G5D9P3_AQUCA|nr:hypothetical protein AQUCO_02500148v1 [Aquilegia coerulea]
MGGTINKLSVCWPIISCNSLEDLTLGIINLKWFTNTNVKFPNLRTMYLDEVNICSVNVINQHLSNCPLLESLVLSTRVYEDEVEDHSNDTVIIPSPNLKTLWLSLSKWPTIHEIKFFSKNLHTLGYHGGVPPPNFDSDILSSLDEANFNITPKAGLPNLNDATAGDIHWASKILMDLCNVHIYPL